MNKPNFNFQGLINADEYFIYIEDDNHEIENLDEYEVLKYPKKLSFFFTKLGNVFQKLTEQHGYTCRHNHTCFNTCGWDELSVKEQDKAVFYHNQDFNRFLSTVELNLSWSGDGHLITRIFAEHDFCVVWEGKLERRITLSFWTNGDYYKFLQNEKKKNVRESKSKKPKQLI